MVKAIVINGGSDEKGTKKAIDFLDIHAEHQVLKYAAGKQMFCPVANCGNILDYKKTVVIEFTFGRSIVMCSKCFDSEPVQKQMRIFKDKIKEVTRYRKV